MRLLRPAAIAILVGLGPALCGSADTDKVVFLCEEAFAHLKECCPNFTATALGYCHADSPGCDGVDSYPALGVNDSNCIRGMTCDELVSKGICARAASAQVQPNQVDDAGVCP